MNPILYHHVFSYNDCFDSASFLASLAGVSKQFCRIVSIANFSAFTSTSVIFERDRLQNCLHDPVKLLCSSSPMCFVKKTPFKIHDEVENLISKHTQERFTKRPTKKFVDKQSLAALCSIVLEHSKPIVVPHLYLPPAMQTFEGILSPSSSSRIVFEMYLHKCALNNRFEAAAQNAYRKNRQEHHATSSFVDRFPNLRVLSLRGVDITDISPFVIQRNDSATSPSLLSELDLTDCASSHLFYRGSPSGFDKLPSSPLTNLTYLSLQKTHLERLLDGSFVLGECLRDGTPNLRILDLCAALKHNKNTKITSSCESSSSLAILRGIEELRFLHSVDFSFNKNIPLSEFFSSSPFAKSKSLICLELFCCSWQLEDDDDDDVDDDNQSFEETANIRFPNLKILNFSSQECHMNTDDIITENSEHDDDDAHHQDQVRRRPTKFWQRIFRSSKSISSPLRFLPTLRQLNLQCNYHESIFLSDDTLFCKNWFQQKMISSPPPMTTSWQMVHLNLSSLDFITERSLNVLVGPSSSASPSSSLENYFRFANLLFLEISNTGIGRPEQMAETNGDEEYLPTQMFSWIQYLPSLENLDISSCWGVRELTCENFVQYLPKPHKLRELSIIHCQSMNGDDAIISGLDHIDSLIVLNCKGVDICTRQNHDEDAFVSDVMRRLESKEVRIVLV